MLPQLKGQKKGNGNSREGTDLLARDEIGEVLLFLGLRPVSHELIDAEVGAGPVHDPSVSRLQFITSPESRSKLTGPRSSTRYSHSLVTSLP